MAQPTGALSYPLRFPGQSYVAATGLHGNGWRDYNPATGRYLESDPIGLAGGLNPYAYAGGNPVSAVDPQGKNPLLIAAVAGALLGAGGDIALQLGDNGFNFGCINWGEAAHYAVEGALFGATAGFAAEAAMAGLAVDAAVEAAGWEAAGARATAAMAADGAAAGGGVAAAGVPALAAVAASSAVGIGEYAGESIAARSAARDFTMTERAEVNRIGSQTGCQTCGTTNPGTKSGNFVPDHQPPSAINPAGSPQRLFPQCIDCSRQQGLELARQLLQGAR